MAQKNEELIKIDTEPSALPLKILDFNFNEKQFEVRISSAIKNTEISSVDNTGINIVLEVFSGQDMHVEIYGVFHIDIYSGNSNFYSSLLQNLKIEEEIGGLAVAQGHEKGIVAETIKQLILNGIVDFWYSSSSLTPGGVKLYERLSEDEALISEKRKAFIGDKNAFRYVLSMRR